MTDNARNMEEVAQGQSHTFDITFLDRPNGSPIHPDGFDPLTPSVVSMITVRNRIYTVSTDAYAAPPAPYNQPTFADLRYAGTVGKFLVDMTALSNSKLTTALVDERWTIEWLATVGGVSLSAPTSSEFYEVTVSGGASFGDVGYAPVSCVREELVQGLKKDAFTVTAAVPATAYRLRLPDKTTEAIVEVLVNGAITTAYTFDGIDTLQFNPVLAVDAVVKVTRDTKVSDARIHKDSVVVSNLINAILGTRYTIPFDLDHIPPIIGSAACALTAMRIRERLFGSTGNTPGDPHAIREWDIWMNLLRGIAAGEQSLIDVDGIVVEPRNRGFYVSNKNERPLFSLEDEPDLHGIPANRNYPKDDYEGYST